MKQEEMKIQELFDTTRSIAGRFFADYTYPWELLPQIGEFIKALGAVLPESEYNKIGPSIWVHKSVKVPPTACMGSPAIICQNAQIRTGVFIRGNVIVGEGAVVGNSVELKNAILFDKAQVPHFNYVGDSILGYKAHMGAGAVTSNIKSDKEMVSIHGEDGDIATDRKKVGAFLGDEVEIGCNSVLNPGTVIGRNTSVYPLSSVRGCVPANSIYKSQEEIVSKR